MMKHAVKLVRFFKHAFFLILLECFNKAPLCLTLMVDIMLSGMCRHNAVSSVKTVAGYIYTYHLLSF